MNTDTEALELEAALVPEIFQPLPLVDLYNEWQDKEQYSSLCGAEHEAASEKVGLTRALSQQRSIRDSFVKVCPANRRSIHLLGLPESDYHVLLELLSVIRPEYQKIHSVINDLRALVTDTAAKQESALEDAEVARTLFNKHFCLFANTTPKIYAYHTEESPGNDSPFHFSDNRHSFFVSLCGEKMKWKWKRPASDHTDFGWCLECLFVLGKERLAPLVKSYEKKRERMAAAAEKGEGMI